MRIDCLDNTPNDPLYLQQHRITPVGATGMAAGDTDKLPAEKYADYLLMLTRLHLATQLQGKLYESDIALYI